MRRNGIVQYLYTENAQSVNETKSTKKIISDQDIVNVSESH